MKHFRTPRIAMLAASAAVTVAFALPASSQATQLMYRDCGTVGAHAFCLIGFGGAPITNGYGRFSLNNGSGVNHVAGIEGNQNLPLSFGNYTTAQDAYSPCIYISHGGSVSGGNDPASGHSYNVAAFTC